MSAETQELDREQIARDAALGKLPELSGWIKRTLRLAGEETGLAQYVATVQNCSVKFLTMITAPDLKEHIARNAEFWGITRADAFADMFGSAVPIPDWCYPARPARSAAHVTALRRYHTWLILSATAEDTWRDAQRSGDIRRRDLAYWVWRKLAPLADSAEVRLHQTPRF